MRCLIDSASPGAHASVTGHAGHEELFTKVKLAGLPARAKQHLPPGTRQITLSWRALYCLATR
jgi:hypothetical protein